MAAAGQVTSLMPNNQIEVQLQERHKTYMQFCCSEARCFRNFLDLDDRIMDADPEPLFNYCHQNDNNVFVLSTPLTRKWAEFLQDLWEWQTHKLFEQNYVTDIDVNNAGQGKIFAAWRVLDQYRGRFRRKNLTRNVVDIRITIPERNLFITEHFCYKYFQHSRGSPYTLVPHILKTIVAKLLKNLTRNVVDIRITIPERNLFITEHFCYKYFQHSRGSPYTLVPHILKTIVAKLYDRYYTDTSLVNIKESNHMHSIYLWQCYAFT